MTTRRKDDIRGFVKRPPLEHGLRGDQARPPVPARLSEP